MEMGQPPSVADTDPAVWVNSRQYTGRLVTVTNGVIFSEPVYNYTRDFPYLWEEIALPISYRADRAEAEAVLLAAARAHAVVDDPRAEAALVSRCGRRYALSDAGLEPAVYWRITDNWLELSLRFLVEHRGVRDVKDAMTRDILGRARRGRASRSRRRPTRSSGCRSSASRATDRGSYQPGTPSSAEPLPSWSG